MVSRTFCQWDLALPIQFMMENGWLLLSARSQAAWTFSDNLRWHGFDSDKSLIHMRTPISVAFVDSHEDWCRSCIRPSLKVSMFSPRSPIQLLDFMRFKTFLSLALLGTQLMMTSIIQSTIVFVQ